MMDYTRFRERRVQFSVNELLDAIIKTDEREVATFKKGDRILWRSTSQWCIGEVKAERRNMKAISGHIINDEQESIQPVWHNSSRIKSMIISPTMLTVTPLPTPAPPIAPQYQILERTSTPDEEQPALSAEDISLLSTEVRNFLSSNPVNSGLTFTSEGHFPPPNSYTLAQVREIARGVLPQSYVPSLARIALASSTVNQHRQTLQ